MTLSAAEQYALELINRARLDPAAEAIRYGVSLNAGLSAGTISTDARQVLAPNQELHVSAHAHSDWMLETNTFSHTGVDDSTPGVRMNQAGYLFEGSWGWRENLAWSGTSGTMDLEAAIDGHHEGLYLSAGHRTNTFATTIREVGIAQVGGDFVQDGVAYDSSMLTVNFAHSGTDVFVTGVAFDDRDGDDFYSIGEGLGGIWFEADGARVTTEQAGGYGIGVTASDDVLVQVGQGDLVLAELRMDLSDGNGKLDLMADAHGAPVLLLSADATLVSGIPDATLLGVGDLNLTGNDADNVLTGNSGDNVLDGAGGDDQLFGGGRRPTAFDEQGSNADMLQGGAGDDMLSGQAGADVLMGGAGDDTLEGGGGRDTFVFTEGEDQITDFTDNVDMIEIETFMTVEQVLDLGEMVDGNAVFDFGDGNVLTVEDVTHISALENDLLVI